MNKVKIDKKKCIGCGTCAALAPGIFEIGKDFKANFKGDVTLDAKKMGDIIASCPMGAINRDN
ncbi:MAG: ferredoxin [Patescibacteria group bacterium]